MIFTGSSFLEKKIYYTLFFRRIAPGPLFHVFATCACIETWHFNIGCTNSCKK